MLARSEAEMDKSAGGVTVSALETKDVWAMYETAQMHVSKGEYEDGSELLGQVLESLVPSMGQFNKELAKVYVSYGRALFQVAVNNKDSLLNTSVMMPEDVLEAEIVGASTSSGSKRTKVLELDSDDDEEEADAEESESEKEAEGQEPESEQQDNEQEEQEQVDDFQVAWEVLDIARMIFADTASADEKSKSSLAQVHNDLALISMETEAFDQAATDFNTSIQLMKELKSCPPSERLLASSYFQLALALEYDNKLAEAINPLKEARNLLSKRLETLRKNIEERDADDKGKEKADNEMDKELAELEELLPEVEGKIKELISQIKAPNTEADNIKATINNAASTAARDLSNLVKRKATDN